MTTKEILIAAKAKVEAGWCQGAYARDDRGYSTIGDQSDAVSWCMSGALGAVSGWQTFKAEQAIRPYLGNDNLVQWNDRIRRTKAEVIAVFDQAIASL